MGVQERAVRARKNLIVRLKCGLVPSRAEKKSKRGVDISSYEHIEFVESAFHQTLLAPFRKSKIGEKHGHT